MNSGRVQNISFGAPNANTGAPRAILGLKVFLALCVLGCIMFIVSNSRISSLPNKAAFVGEAPHTSYNVRMRSNTSTEHSSTSQSSRIFNPNPVQYSVDLPKLVHHTWKSGSRPPAETIRWRRGCMLLNPEYEFKMYDDDELLDFVVTHYPRYLPMFKKLHGVYMADMARILVTYHFGGIYLDLDFYCHRPYSCLLNHITQKLLPAALNNRVDHENVLFNGNEEPNKFTHRHLEVKDLLVVSLEPSVHAVLFRSKRRVVIQDFFLATPRHPFLLWLLEDRLTLFNQPDVKFPKGPFSYSIDKDIDRYHSLYASRNRTGINGGLILELKEDILHPLIDATNSRLQSSCIRHFPSRSDSSSLRIEHEVGAISAANADAQVTATDVQEACSIVQQKHFFRPSEDTVLVHMWTHVYLGWNFLRGVYNSISYYKVEYSLPQTSSCHP